MNGLISFGTDFCESEYSENIASPPLIAGFWGDIDISTINTLPDYYPSVHFIELNSSMSLNEMKDRFNKATNKMLYLLRKAFGCSEMSEFKPTHIFLATWHAVKRNGANPVSIYTHCILLPFLYSVAIITSFLDSTLTLSFLLVYILAHYLYNNY